MGKWFIVSAGVAAIISFAPVSAGAQISVEAPGGVGVHVGERPYYREYRDYDRPAYREREVGLRGGCKTVTIQREDGLMKRIRRCDP
jgi:hypothetical protein